MPGIRFGSPTGARPRSAEALSQDLLWHHLRDTGVPTLGEARKGRGLPAPTGTSGAPRCSRLPGVRQSRFTCRMPRQRVSLLACVPKSRSVDETACPDQACMADALSSSLQ